MTLAKVRERWLLLCLLVFSPLTLAESKLADLSQHSDQALTELASEWDTLSAASRRVLLKEMQRRMSRQRQASQSQRRGKGRLLIRTERRFGRRVKQPDGSVVTIATRIVRLQSRPSSATSRADSTGSPPTLRTSGPFGVGFERRAAQRPQPAAQPVSDASDAPPNS